MTQLKCSAQTCMYNENHYCSKGDIMVEGKNASDSTGTYCASFKERTDANATNSVGHPSKNIEVDCQAVKCVYNKECKCTAKEIGIAGSHACTSDDTECASFECKCS